jgi:hypothetical protein
MYYKSLIIGIILFIIGYLYIYKQKIILQINQYIREVIFSDVPVITNHKKIGVFFMLLALIFIYIGVAYRH